MTKHFHQNVLVPLNLFKILFQTHCWNLGAPKNRSLSKCLPCLWIKTALNVITFGKILCDQIKFFQKKKKSKFTPVNSWIKTIWLKNLFSIGRSLYWIVTSL